jgi:hypothetical protein
VADNEIVLIPQGSFDVLCALGDLFLDVLWDGHVTSSKVV